jgi:hypothetical protein
VSDAAQLLAMQHVVAASAQIEAQIKILDGGFPILIMLHKARAEAADALRLIASSDLETPITDIRHWQNEFARFQDLVRWLADLLEEGVRYDQEITADERDELWSMLSQSPEGERIAKDVGLYQREIE